jgi:homoserine O-acetyltransferase
MPETIPEDSIGLVEPKTLQIDKPLKLQCGRMLDGFHLVYEEYGELNADHSNAILICHALSSDQHAAGYNSMEDRKPGWWETAIGPGKVIDTDRYYVVCLNNLGGCKGSSGPNQLNRQAMFADALGIEQFAAIIGGSLGGMQVLQWSIDYPQRLRHAIIIAAAPKLSTQNIAFNEVARQAIMTDPEFHEGRYYDLDTVPKRGLMLARMLGHITYLSDDAMRDKFGRELREGKLNYGFDVDFQIESYLRYQGKSFVDRFDANTYLLMTKVLDYFDPAGDFDDSLTKALANASADFFVVSFSSDWRFSPARSREIVKALLDNGLNVSYSEIDVPHGHDAFLLPIRPYLEVFGAYMQRVK